MPDPRTGDDEAAPLIWRSTPARLALAALPLWLTGLAIVSAVDWPIRAIVALVLAMTLVNPAHGLLAIAIIAPMAELLGQVIGARTFRLAEAIVLAFLAGWLLRALPDRRGPRVAAAPGAWLFATVVAASIAGLAWKLSSYPRDMSIAIAQLTHAYFFITDPIGVVEGARLLEGIGLAAAVVMLLRRSPALAVRLPLAIGASAAAAALSSVLLSRGIASAETLARYRLIGYRISGHIGDVNAAGSYFAMTLCLMLGMAIRARGRARAGWIVLAAASSMGLWLSRSQSALGAAVAVIAVAATWAVTRRFSARSRAAALAGAFVVLAAGAAFRAQLLEAKPGYRGVGFREQFNATSLRMIAARPIAGLGVGQYYWKSHLFLSPQLAWSYGFENAHNYFLQIAGELGLIGAGLFAICLGAGLTRSGRALARAPLDGRLLGAAAGIAAFLITCVTGHPFLLGEVAYPFWLQFGLMSGLAGSTLLNRAGGPHPVWTRGQSGPLAWWTAAALVMFVGVAALTANGVDAPADTRAVNGFYGWETDGGKRVRWTGEYASLFVPADVTRVSIPVRLPSNGGTARPMGVEVKTAGTSPTRTMVDDAWAIIDVSLPRPGSPAQFKRIDLKADRTWQPAVYLAGSADLRFVGVQVGEPQLFRK